MPVLTELLPTRVRTASEGNVQLVRRAAGRIEAEPELRDWCRDYVRTHEQRLAVDLDLLDLIDPARTARGLDVGSVPPVLLAACAEQGRDAAGVDIDPSRFQQTIDAFGLDVRACNVEMEPLPFDDATFDLVLLNEVFEHLRIDLVFTVGELTRVLAPNGLLCISTPNARSWRGLLNIVCHNRSGWCGAADLYAQWQKLRVLGHMGHVREYTSTEVEAFLEHFGLTVIHVVWRGDSRERVHRRIDHFVPSLAPFMTLIAQRTDTPAPDAEDLTFERVPGRWRRSETKARVTYREQSITAAVEHALAVHEVAECDLDAGLTPDLERALRSVTGR